jgi:anti-anti-sigma factor
MNTFGHTVTDHGDHVRLALTGDVDFAAHAVLAEQIGTLVAGGRAVTVDCAGVTFLDSMGLRALIEGLRAADAEGVGFELARPSQPVLRVMELSGTTELFAIRGLTPEDSGS